MSVRAYIERLEQERAGLIQSMNDYTNQVQTWRGDLVTLDAVLEILRSGEVPEPPPNTDPVGEVEEVVVDDEPAAEQPAPVDEAPADEPNTDQAPAGTEPDVEPSAEATEEPSEAAPAEPQADAPAEVSESADAPTTESDTAR